MNRQKFLVTALKLFHKKGYENTSVNDILRVLNSSKGAFYHYFKSKEEVLEALVEKEVEELIRIVEKIVNDAKSDALKKFNKMVREVQKYKADNVKEHCKLFGVLKHYGNLKLFHKLHEKTMSTLRPLIRKIIEQGAAEEVFNNPYPEELAEMYIHIMHVFQHAVKKDKKKIAFYRDMFERLLGAPENSIKLTLK